ncbi:MAG: DUF1801 domain-containing protein [Bacteroidetes bacterium]|nr:DUF1801 domain-containing protein [Bacteroidota bacterium]
MATLKTTPTNADVEAFLNSIQDEQKRKDSFVLLELFKEVTQSEPKMWGESIIGFGDYHYKYASGREGDWFMAGFSPRKQNLSLYFMPGAERYKDDLAKLGKHKTGKACLYVKKLDDINLDVLKDMLNLTVQALKM